MQCNVLLFRTSYFHVYVNRFQVLTHHKAQLGFLHVHFNQIDRKFKVVLN